MAEAKKVRARLIDATYIKEAKSILLILECDKGRFRSQIHRDAIATYGNRSEEEIAHELNKYVEMLKVAYIGRDRFINAIFDPDLLNKIKDHYPLKY